MKKLLATNPGNIAGGEKASVDAAITSNTAAMKRDTADKRNAVTI